MNQWLERLDTFLDIDEDLPEYKTKTGRTRKRKSLIGSLQGARDTLTGIVDVAMIRSLKKKDGFHPMLKEYGQVYFDDYAIIGLTRESPEIKAFANVI